MGKWVDSFSFSSILCHFQLGIFRELAERPRVGLVDDAVQDGPETAPFWRVRFPSVQDW
jgi:hypothetical protein